MKLKNISTTTVKRESGIYIIRNLVSKKVYVGQAKSVYTRLIHHKHELLTGTHGNSHLQRSFNKHGEDNFEFDIIEYCDSEILTEKEREHINSQDSVYNMKEAADHPGGSKQKNITQEHKDKISEALKGKTPSNFWTNQKNSQRKIAYYYDGKLKKVFDSCKEAAAYFKMDTRAFHYAIGKERKQKSKYFTMKCKVEYYEK